MQQDIDKSDIERYALGLSSPREIAKIERAMEERPELRQLVQDIQRDLHEYAERIDIPPLRPGVTPNPNRFSELDEEMLELMSRQNERLRRWVALASLLFLIVGAICFYLYYQNGQLTTQLREERATLRQELNYAHNHLDQAERQMDAWESDAQFATQLPVDDVPEVSVGLYTFETGKKVMLNVAKVPPRIESLAVWDQRYPNHIIHHLRCDQEDDLHYLNLESRDQIKWLRVSVVSEAEVALSEK